MRLRIVLFLALVGMGLTLSLWRREPAVAGLQLLGALEAQKGPARGALMLLDYAPDEAELVELRREKLRSGEGSLPGEGLLPAPGQKWAVAADREFLWRAAEIQPLRATISENGPARLAMAETLARAGYYQEVAQSILQRAAAELEKLPDEELFLAWLRADRAIMEQSEDPVRATREGLLLEARQNAGPAILFALKRQQVYLLPMDGARGDSASTWVQMEAYEEHRLKWMGVLRMAGSPEPGRVRAMSARMAELAGTP